MILPARTLRPFNRRQMLATMALASAGIARGVPALAAQTPVATDAGSTAFLDASTVHDIGVTFDQDAYDEMVETFRASGDKDWIEATVEIDGASYEQAGMRLKGNSSLGGLRGSEGLPPVEDVDETDEAANDRGNVRVEGGGATADEPEQLPWLIRLDKFVDDQHHEGITELVVRSNRSETSLNEAVALELLDLAGLASQRAALTRYTVNDSDQALRLVIEHPSDAWMAAHFSADGCLFKAEAGGDWSYRGDDPDAYKDAFDLEAGGTGDDASDMQPLFDFLAFINDDSDDATFAAELSDHLDIDQFAAYLAMMDLIGNFDGIDGPGNNAYLYVGPNDRQFTVVPWDMNLAFGGGGRVIFGDPGSGGPGELPPPPDGADVHIQESGEASAGERVWPAGGTPSADFGLDSNGAGDPPAPTPNILVERWNAADEFTGMVETASERLRSDLIESGVAADTLDRWVGVLESQASDMLDANTIATESDAIAEFFT